MSETAAELYADTIDADAIARAVEYALAQPGEVDVNELIIRPAAQVL